MPGQAKPGQPAASEKARQLAQAVSSAPADLSAAAMIELAAEYAWNEDADGERGWLEAAATKPPSSDTARAMVLLAEARFFAGDKDKGQSLLDAVRAQYREPEVLAFAGLVQALSLMAPESSAHGKRYYADAGNSRRLYTEAAQKWPGTFLGGWASIRLAAVYRNQLDQPKEAIVVSKQTASDYPGVVGESALEDLAATITFSLGEFGAGRELYEQLLETGTRELTKQRATLHLGELLMDIENYDTAYQLFSSFVSTWPQHADSVGARMLHGYAAAQLNRWEEAVADAREYLRTTVPRLPVYVAKAHVVLGRAAFVQGQFDLAETEFLLVDDQFLAPEAKASAGHCRARRGDLRGALSAFLEAASLADRANAPSYLYQAARLARESGDQTAFGRILQQMESEFPANSLTSLLAGREVVPAPGI